VSVNTSLIIFAKMDASVAAVSRDLVDGVVISAEFFILTRFFSREPVLTSLESAIGPGVRYA
jgi:hypothetical protein